jgi:hypothetical protein
MAQTVVTLMVSMIEFPGRTLLVASIRFTELLATCPVTTRLAAVTMSAIAAAADVENLAASRGVASALMEDEFQGATVPSRRWDSTRPPVSWQANVSLVLGALTSSWIQPRSLTRSGFFLHLRAATISRPEFK